MSIMSCRISNPSSGPVHDVLLALCPLPLPQSTTLPSRPRCAVDRVSPTSPAEYNTLSESASGSEPAGDDEPHMIVEEEPGDEEDPVAAAAGIGRLNLSGDGHKDG